ncbi:MAG: glycoside hydrolase family 127 protein [Bacteroidales bacterium]|nr:glycoside hydrolase family 127 protein [Bacteroidales bacterium]
MKTFSRAILFLLLLFSCKPDGYNDKGFEYIGLSGIRVNDGFWKSKMDLVNDITVHDLLDKCYKSGAVRNLEIAAGIIEGTHTGMWFSDEHLYKAIGAACYSLMVKWDDRLDARLDSIISIIAKAQEPDGYLNSNITGAMRHQPSGTGDQGRYKDLKGSLEIYCLGELYDAAIAHKIATGKDDLLNVALKSAGHLNNTFGKDQGKCYDVDGHELIELALVKLYEFTGEKQHFDLARFFVEARGDSSKRKLYGPFYQDHMPFIEQKEAVGQAPRATYLYSAAADIAFHNHDKAYIDALNILWDDVAGKKMYITGGIGSKHENEGFGAAYDLPSLTAYCETCAAISFSMWNTRMFRLQQEAKYFDVLELTMYNNLLAGFSLEGNSYFYPCPLESDGRYKFNLGFDLPDRHFMFNEPRATRKEWFPCACCPGHLARYILKIPGYIYAVKNDMLFVNLFIDSEAEITIGKRNIKIIQQTDYPWNGKINLRFETDKPAEMNLLIRIPGWSTNKVVPTDLYSFSDRSDEMPALSLNGKSIEIVNENGYANISRTWENGDELILTLPMSARRVIANEKVEENKGKVALMFGPVVYCLEKIDNKNIKFVSISDKLTIEREYIPDLLGGTYVLGGDYEMNNETVKFRAIPYYKWSNRGENIMKVWLP